MTHPLMHLQAFNRNRAVPFWVLVLLLPALVMLPQLFVDHHNPLAFEQAQTEQHQLLATESHDHGHLHSDGDIQEQKLNHLHGHNPADHSHESVSLTLQQALALVACWVLMVCYHYSAILFRPKPPKRPPKIAF
ncbi:MAG: hypothetical protein CMH98_01250 [Oceanospirillaceae bacterium]|nr:hypothetical protein [Oceanospirillaceae bacterium]